MERDSDHAVDTVIVGLQKIYSEAKALGLNEVAHLASTALLAAEEEAERRIVLHRDVGAGQRAGKPGTVFPKARQPDHQTLGGSA